MRMISYAQNGEDVVLRRLFPEGGGVYVDVGANDPTHHSVTKHFYDRGWAGVNVEPEPAAFRRVRAARGRDRNANVGISDREGTLTFYDAPAANGWSTFSADQAGQLRDRGVEVVEREVPVWTLAGLCDRLLPAVATIDFLKVDAESHEREVRAGGDWARWRPRVVLVEATGHLGWEGILRGNDYLHAMFDGINRWYVRREDAGLMPSLAAGPNFLDDYAPYEHAREVEGLRGRLAAVEGIGPRALAVARALSRASGRLRRRAG